MQSSKYCEGANYISISKIAEVLNIPVPSVKRLVGMLKKAGLVFSKTGATGGLILSKRADEIRLYDILVAIEGQSPLFEVHEGFDIAQFPVENDVKSMMTRSKQILKKIESGMMEALKEQFLADLISGDKRKR